MHPNCHLPKGRVSIELLWLTIIPTGFATVFAQRTEVLSFSTGGKFCYHVVDQTLHVILQFFRRHHCSRHAGLYVQLSIAEGYQMIVCWEVVDHLDIHVVPGFD